MFRIIDLTSHSGVYATRLLAETGHDVIRVEPPQGDNLRRLGPHLGNKPEAGQGVYHEFFNAGKRSLSLDLKQFENQRVFLDLIGSAHVLVANLPLPLEEKKLLERNPNLILVKVDDGEPELCAYAHSGLLSITGHPGKSPVLVGGHVVYAATGLYVAVATAVAMHVMQLSGKGQAVNVSIRQCMESLVEQAMVTHISTGKSTERLGYRGAVTAVSGAFPCQDGYWMLSVPHTPEGWKKFMEWVQDPVLMNDHSLEDEAERNEKKNLILDRLALWSKKFSKGEIVEEAQNLHIPAAPVSTPLDLIRDPQLIARGFLAELDHPQFGRILWPKGAIANVRGAQLRTAPSLGQHNDEILKELGNLSSNS